MGEIFKLFGSIGVKNDEANRKIDDTKRRGHGLAKSLGRALKGVGKFAIGIGAAAATGAAALFGLANKAAAATDRIDKLSQRLGISREGFQEWEFVLSQNGVEIDSLQAGMKALSRSMYDTMQGTGRSAEIFDALGVSITDSSGNLKDQEEIFEELVKKLQGMEDGTLKASYAQQLFGRSGQELLPLLNQSAESTEELKEKAHELGLVLNDEAIDAGVEFTDSLDAVKRSFGSVVAQIGTKVMPIMLELFDWIQEHMPEIQEVISVVFTAIGDAVTIVVDVFNEYLMPVFTAIYEWVAENWPAIQETITTVLNTIWSVIESVFTLIQVFWEAWGETIMTYLGHVWNAIKTIFETTLNVIKGIVDFWIAVFTGDWKGAWNAVKNIASSIWNGIKEYFSTVINAIWNIITSILSVVGQWFSDTWSGLKQIVSDIWKGIYEAIFGWVDDAWTFISDTFSGIGGWFSDTWEGVEETVSGIWKGIARAIMGPIGWVIEKAQSAINWLGELIGMQNDVSSIHVSGRGGSYGGGGRGFAHAEGGIFTKPTLLPSIGGNTHLVGEAGAEAILPLERLPELISSSMNVQGAVYRGMIAAIKEMDIKMVIDKREFGRLVMD